MDLWFKIIYDIFNPQILRNMPRLHHLLIMESLGSAASVGDPQIHPSWLIIRWEVNHHFFGGVWPSKRCWLVVWLPFFIFPYVGNNHPNWLIFFRGVETTNQIQFDKQLLVVLFVFFCWLLFWCTRDHRIIVHGNPVLNQDLIDMESQGRSWTLRRFLCWLNFSRHMYWGKVAT